MVALAVSTEMRSDPAAGAGLALALPAMHLSWGAGFLVGWSRRFLMPD